ncbi:ferritin family protein [Candidatus Altiarchaeota archaeon]
MGEKTLEVLLRNAIELEERGYAFYKECLNLTDDENGKAMFDHLANEEIEHAKWITKYLDRPELDKGSCINAPDMKEVEEKVFSKEVAGRSADDTADALEALNIGIKAEENSITLYKSLMEQACTDEGTGLFQKLVSEEEKHKAILEKEIEFITETGEFQDFKQVSM